MKNSGRVEVGVGSNVKLLFNKPIAKVVSLSGTFLKTELLDSVEGKIIKVYPSERLMENGKPDYLFEVAPKNGESIKINRSNIKFCYVLD